MQVTFDPTTRPRLPSCGACSPRHPSARYLRHVPCAGTAPRPAARRSRRGTPPPPPARPTPNRSSPRPRPIATRTACHRMPDPRRHARPRRGWNWRKRRGVDEAVVAQVEAELRALVAVQPPADPAEVFKPADAPPPPRPLPGTGSPAAPRPLPPLPVIGHVRGAHGLAVRASPEVGYA